MSLRLHILLAFALLAGALVVATLLSIRGMTGQYQAAIEANRLEEGQAAALATLRSLPSEAEGLVMAHLDASDPALKADFEAALLAASTREMLALARLKDLARGAEGGLVARLTAQAGQAADLRDAILEISDRDAEGAARRLATEAMPGLRAELLATLEDVALQGNQDVAAERAGKALNAIAAAQKNALLGAEADFIAAQFDEISRAEIELTAALTLIATEPVPAAAPLREMVAALSRLDEEIAAALREMGAAEATQIFTEKLRPLDAERIATLDALAALSETARRSAADAALTQLEARQQSLVLGADGVLLFGFLLLALGLRRIGRGIEGAVRLAERMADRDGGAAPLLGGSLAERLIAALTRISSGQGAILVALEGLGHGRPPQPNVPERFRQALGRLSHVLDPAAQQLRSDEAMRALKSRATASVHEAQSLRGEAEEILARLPAQLPAKDELMRHALRLDRHAANLMTLGQEAGALAPPIPPLRQIA